MAYLKLIIFIIMISLFSGCGAPVDETPIDASLQKEEPAQIDKPIQNNKPVAKTIDKITRETGVSVNILNETYDAENDKLSFTWKEGNTILSTDQNFNIANLSEGDHNITFTVTDSYGATDSKLVKVTIVSANNRNDAPVAIDQNIITDEDKSVTFELNAYDVEGDNLTKIITKNPSHGKLTGNYPYFTYTPNENFRGSDEISYKVNDGNSSSNEATIYIKINNVNDAPTVDAGTDKKIRVLHTTWINGVANDNDGIITKFEWKENNKLLSTNQSFKYKPKTIGTHQLTLTVTDNENATTSDTMTVNATNKLPLLIVRIEFNNFQFHSDETTWSNKIFSTAKGDLNDYYNEISYGRLQFEKAKESGGTVDDGVVTVSLDENHPGNAVDFQEFLPRVIQLTDQYIDYSQYDTNEDNIISMDELQVMFLMAGGENATGNYPGIWAHASCIAEAPTLDGEKLMECGHGTYSIFGERHKTGESEHDATIGIIAHELAHASFGLVDLYDRDGSSEGIGNFGLMGSGNWGQKDANEKPGETPVHMTAWNKIESKFIEAIEINQSTSITLNATSREDFKAYKISTKNPNEYFLLENRDNSGYDRGLFILKHRENFKGGVMISHVDENVSRWEVANDDENHKLVDIEEATHPMLDTNSSGRGDIYNLYFSGNSDSFTPTTTPNSNLYDGTNSNISITNISDSGNTMSADINLGE